MLSHEESRLSALRLGYSPQAALQRFQALDQAAQGLKVTSLGHPNQGHLQDVPRVERPPHFPFSLQQESERQFQMGNLHMSPPVLELPHRLLTEPQDLPSA